MTEETVLVSPNGGGTAYHAIAEDGDSECARVTEDGHRLSRESAEMYHEPCEFCYGNVDRSHDGYHPAIGILEEADPDAFP